MVTLSWQLFVLMLAMNFAYLGLGLHIGKQAKQLRSKK